MNIHDAEIIAFTGKKGSGKSTAVEYMMSKLPGARINFKDALIQELKDKFPRLLEYLSGAHGISVDNLFTEKPAPVRFLMQEYGTNVRRWENSWYWTDKWGDAVDDCEHDRVYTDDVRFLNEATIVSMKGGIIIRIEREGHEANDTHISETEMDRIIPSHTIRAGSKEELYQKLDALLEDMTLITRSDTKSVTQPVKVNFYSKNEPVTFTATKKVPQPIKVQFYVKDKKKN